MTAPWLSVVVPVYNGRRHLAQALDSIAQQVDDSVECIVVDDGSTDGSVDLARSFENRLRLDVIVGPRRGNWIATTNVGLGRATGTFVCFLHQDDLWRPGRLSLVRTLLTRCPQASMVFHAAGLIDAAGNDLGGWRAPFPSPSVLSPRALLEKLLVQNFIQIAAPAFRREFVVERGLDEALWYTADWDFWLRIAATGPTVYAAEPLVAFRIHHESQTVRRSADQADFSRQLAAVLERHLPTWTAPPRQRRTVERLALASNAINVSLAGVLHGDYSRIPTAMRAVGRLGPVGWWRLIRITRLRERIAARVRARLHGSVDGQRHLMRTR